MQGLASGFFTHVVERAAEMIVDLVPSCCDMLNAARHARVRASRDVLRRRGAALRSRVEMIDGVGELVFRRSGLYRDSFMVYCNRPTIFQRLHRSCPYSRFPLPPHSTQASQQPQGPHGHRRRILRLPSCCTATVTVKFMRRSELCKSIACAQVEMQL